MARRLSRAHRIAACVAVACAVSAPAMVGPKLAAAAGASGLEPVSPFSMGFVSPAEGWAANGLWLYFTGDDGAHWQLLHPPGIGGDLANNLTSFASVGTRDMWFGGITGKGYGTCQHPSVPARSGVVFVYGAVDRSTNGGRSWSEARLPDCGVAGSLSFANAEDGYALGPASTGTFSPARGRLYRTLDGGRSWQLVGPVPFGGALVGPRSGSSIAFPSLDEGFAVSSYASTGGSLYRTSDGGRQWQEVVLPLPPGYSARALFGTPQFFSAKLGVVPALLERATSGTEALVVFTTDDGGQRWAVAKAPADKALGLYPAQGTVPFSAATPSTWFSYPGPRLYTTHDEGEIWAASVPLRVARAGTVQAVQFASALDGWAIVKSVLETTTNGGRTWRRAGA